MLMPKKELINCIELLYNTDTGNNIDNNIDNKFEDIIVFFEKNTKSNNDYINKIRESIIENILNNKIPKQWYSSPQWFKIALKLKDFLKPLELEYGKLQEVVRKSGRKFNYDFLFVFKINKIKIEFKNGVNSIPDYPQILSVNSNIFIKGMSYPEFFYNNYLSKLTDFILPTKKFYLKNIHKNSINHPFFLHLKEIDTFKKIVDISIDDYLQNILEFDYDGFCEKIKNSQLDKIFMLWNNEQFYLDSISEDEINIVPEKILKIGKNKLHNTLIIKTKNNKTEYHLLLRWKNHAGVLFPAWQIKFIRSKLVKYGEILEYL